VLCSIRTTGASVSAFTNATAAPGGAARPYCVASAHFGHISGGVLSKYLLRLFVTGASSRTAPAIANLRRICEEELQGRYDLEIIDVQEHPSLAEDERILATPTLIKSLPLPLRRVIGDLSDKEKVLLGLQLEPRPDDTRPSEAGA
jgi:circadian clock protein KaiB